MIDKVYIQKRGLRRITWAVMREGRKTAIRIFQDMDAAIDYAISITTPNLMNQWIVLIKNDKHELIRQYIKLTRTMDK